MSKIIGNTTITPYPKSDWAQTDSAKPDFIKNKDLVAGVIVPTVQGANITLNDSNTSPLRNLQIFGLSFVDDEPRPNNPTTIYHKEGATITVGDKQVTVPYTLRGIPVKAEGNYTDANGQQWLCDEVDFEKGVYIQRIYGRVMNSSCPRWGGGWSEKYKIYIYDITDWKTYFWGSNKGCICTHYPTATGVSSKADYFWINTTANYGFNTMDYTTLNDFLAFLDAEEKRGYPVTIWGALPIAQIKETPLTEEELNAYKLLATTYPTTTLSSSNGAGIGVTYCADTKNYIDNKFNKLATAIVANS